VSAHYFVDIDGRILRLVAEEMRAWHAGVSCWGTVRDVNSRSIGIEVVNPGHDLGYSPFPEPQMAALEALLAEIRDRRAIAPERVVGHACIAPVRKRDPGERFDWRRLALAGLSVWLDPEPENRHGDEPALSSTWAARFQEAARRFGYDAPENGVWCERTGAVWRAFQSRFLPFDTGALPHGTGIRHMERLAERWPCAQEA
jgi:N-acetylmuramoyl-L-alanine amidase